MPENLDQVTSFASKNVQIAGVRIAPQPLLHLHRQGVHAAPHIGVPDCQPHPHARGDRDHRRATTLTTAAANAAGTDPGLRSRTLPANSTSMAGSASDVGRSSALVTPLSAGAKTRGDDRRLLLLAPQAPTLRAGDHLDSRHRTAASTSASTVTCTGATTRVSAAMAQGGS